VEYTFLTRFFYVKIGKEIISPPQLLQFFGVRFHPKLAEMQNSKRAWRNCARDQFTNDFEPFKLY